MLFEPDSSQTFYSFLEHELIAGGETEAHERPWGFGWKPCPARTDLHTCGRGILGEQNFVGALGKLEPNAEATRLNKLLAEPVSAAGGKK